VRRAALALAGVLVGTGSGAAQGSNDPGGVIAFVRYTVAIGHPRIYTIASEGGRARRLPLPFTAVAEPTWSRDGSKLAFVSGRNRSGEPDLSGFDDLFVANADGSAPRRLTGRRVQVGQPTWSPDGRAIAYVRSARTANRSALWALDVATGRSRRLTTGRLDIEPSWSPDGKRIVFVRIDTTTYAAAVWQVRPDGTGARPLGRRFRGVTDPVWSPDGRRLLAEDGRALFTLPLSPGPRRAVVRLAADARGAREDPQPAWSPDGRRIVFCQFRDGLVGRSDVWTVGADGRGLKRITGSPGRDGDPSWRG
jgi:TolB protein